MGSFTIIFGQVQSCGSATTRLWQLLVRGVLGYLDNMECFLQVSGLGLRLQGNSFEHLASHEWAGVQAPGILICTLAFSIA